MKLTQLRVLSPQRKPMPYDTPLPKVWKRWRIRDRGQDYLMAIVKLPNDTAIVYKDDRPLFGGNAYNNVTVAMNRCQWVLDSVMFRAGTYTDEPFTYEIEELEGEPSINSRMKWNNCPLTIARGRQPIDWEEAPMPEIYPINQHRNHLPDARSPFQRLMHRDTSVTSARIVTPIVTPMVSTSYPTPATIMKKALPMESRLSNKSEPIEPESRLNEILLEAIQ